MEKANTISDPSYATIIRKGVMPMKNLRLQHGYTLRSLSQATGIPAPALGQMERRIIPVSYEAMQALSTLWQCTIADII